MSVCVCVCIFLCVCVCAYVHVSRVAWFVDVGGIKVALAFIQSQPNCPQCFTRNLSKKWHAPISVPNDKVILGTVRRRP